MPSKERLEKKLLHYTGKAIAAYRLISHGDRLLVCLSGGKDSWGLVWLLHCLQRRAPQRFTLHVLAIDNGIPAWNRAEISAWLTQHKLPFTIFATNIAEVVAQKQQPKISPCVLCSRLRRGYIYKFAREHGYNKVALGHHRDDLITSLLMSMLYGGNISTMPPKLITDDRTLTVIRPLIFCQECDLAAYAVAQQFPISPDGICALKENNTRAQVANLLQQLAQVNQKIPANLLHAMQDVRFSHLLDQRLWDFKNLENNLLPPHYKNTVFNDQSKDI